jgi:DNA-binding transcriptional regulator YiaG
MRTESVVELYVSACSPESDETRTVEGMTTTTTDDLRSLRRVRALVASGTARAIRVNAGLGLAEVARAAGVADRTVRRWEARERVPHGGAALRYLSVLDALTEQR